MQARSHIGTASARCGRSRLAEAQQRHLTFLFLVFTTNIKDVFCRVVDDMAAGQVLSPEHRQIHFEATVPESARKKIAQLADTDATVITQSGVQRVELSVLHVLWR